MFTDWLKNPKIIKGIRSFTIVCMWAIVASAYYIAMRSFWYALAITLIALCAAHGTLWGLRTAILALQARMPNTLNAIAKTRTAAILWFPVASLYHFLSGKFVALTANKAITTVMLVIFWVPIAWLYYILIKELNIALFAFLAAIIAAWGTHETLSATLSEEKKEKLG